ncbi:MAG TPA: ABC transporter permease [Myxococcota bacterium]|nr:ABC transporter permease [Myxococcota bacterium]
MVNPGPPRSFFSLRALERKLLRDLWRLRGQVFAIALVIASGVAVLVMSLGTIEALRLTADAFYERSNFADVFASLKRAPEGLVGRIAEIPGVQSVETRIARYALLDLEDFDEPVIGRIVSIPETKEPVLNRLMLRSGRMVAPGRPDEVVLWDSFAEVHGLMPGSTLRALINGKLRTLQVVGTALSAEYVYAMPPGSLMPDEKRFGVLWMGRDALAHAYDLDGAFDDVSLSLLRGTSPEDVVAELDLLLAPYGGIGAYARKDQLSNWFLMSEIQQLANMVTVLPTIFLAVAAFLTSMVLNRLIAIERSEIGLLKAFGYSNAAVGWHYAQLVIAISSLGVALGVGLGAWFGRGMTAMYAELYRFPFMIFRPSAAVYAIAAAVSIGSALLGTARAVLRAVRLPPAEAMRPPQPTLFASEGIGARIERIFDQPTRMIFRQITRFPTRSGGSVFGIAMAVGLLVTALGWPDSIDRMLEGYFFEGQRQDVTVGFAEVKSSEVTESLSRLPGVFSTEGVRSVAARLRVGPRSRREAIQGIPEHAHLTPVFDSETGVVELPPEGLVISTKLAEMLAVKPGGTITVEVLEGRRPVFEAPVAAVFETQIGSPAYMRSDALHRLLRERPVASAVNLRVDREQEPALFAALKGMPAVTGVSLRRSMVEKFNETMAETMLIFTGVFALFSATLAFGVAYNSTRVSLSERARELATLRVLGQTRAEISYILLGEVALLAFMGLPIGCAVGATLAWFMSSSFETDLYRMPLVLEHATFGWAVAIAVISVAISAAIVRQRLDRLDLIAVLKTRE